jgi:hypothetical protein
MSNDFTAQFAIQMPDGTLYRRAPETDWSRLLGFKSSTAALAESPYIYDTRAEADDALRNLRNKAAAMGITEWFGVVVQRLCTPFAEANPAERLVLELREWMMDQGGAQ